MRQLALLLGGWAARLIQPVRPTQALAMYAEIENLPDREALVWSIGCIAAALRQRASFLAVMVVSARLCVALAAGLFGLVHVWASSMNLWLKVAQLSGTQVSGLTRYHAETIQALPLDHWAWNFATMSTLGGLHIAAALMLAVGQNNLVRQMALGVVVLETAYALLGISGLTLSMIYLVLITMMGAASAILAWLLAWDVRRMSNHTRLT